jgi:polysaccharide pyruvyl transferase WcaK-like protein
MHLDNKHGTDRYGQPLRILIENGEYWLRNNGDLAMMAVTISRLRERWPDARLGVLTGSPALVRAYFPQVQGIRGDEDDPWAAPSWSQVIAGKMGSKFIGPVVIGRLRLRAWLRGKISSAQARLGRLPSALGRLPSATPSATPSGAAKAARSASLVMALGGGYLTDADPSQAARTLALLGHAADHGVPTALVGQGLGPIEDPTLQRQAADVLVRMDFIGLREGRRGPEILYRAGVSADRMLVTGDDAIELAYRVRRQALGAGLGFCLRVASYSPVQRSVRETVGRVVRGQASRKAADLMPLIISEWLSEDRRATLPLLRGAARVVRPSSRYVSAVEVARRVGACRVVVTGAYHLAVFALSQGIPVVGLANSRYYDDKFLGLADMFGVGLTLVRLDSGSLEEELAEGIGSSWDQAPLVREELRGRPQQVVVCREAFRQVVVLTELDNGAPELSAAVRGCCREFSGSGPALSPNNRSTFCRTCAETTSRANPGPGTTLTSNRPGVSWAICTSRTLVRSSITVDGSGSGRPSAVRNESSARPSMRPRVSKARPQAQGVRSAGPT